MTTVGFQAEYAGIDGKKSRDKGSETLLEGCLRTIDIGRFLQSPYYISNKQSRRFLNDGFVVTTSDTE